MSQHAHSCPFCDRKPELCVNPAKCAEADTRNEKVMCSRCARELKNAGPPKRTEKPPEDVSLTGKYIPWSGDHPALLRMPGTDALYFPCFSTHQSLLAVMTRVGSDFTGIKVIGDGKEFIASIPMKSEGQDVHIILDPWHTEDGKVRFVQVQRG